MANHPKFLLRWCFEYNHKNQKYGMWSHPGEFDTEKAYLQNKDHLIRAKIEGKNFLTHEIITLADCAGPNFVNFQWIAAGVQRGLRVEGSAVLPWRVIGLMIISRQEKVKIYDNGMAETEKHHIDYGRVNLAGFGR